MAGPSPPGIARSPGRRRVLRIPETGTTGLAGLEDTLANLKEIENVDLCPLVYVELEAEDAPAVVMGKAEALLREAPVRLAGIRIHRPARRSRNSRYRTGRAPQRAPHPRRYS